MKSQVSLDDRIWNALQTRRRTRIRVVRSAIAVASIGVAGALLLLPRPAFALQEVEQATREFNTVRWIEHNEGVIRDLGSTDPKRIPHFSTTRQHFVSRKPMDVQENWDGWNEWRGWHQRLEQVMVKVGGKPVVQKRLVRRYKAGPSTGLRQLDVDMALSSFSFLAYRWDPNGKQYRNIDLDKAGWTRDDNAQYKGQRVVSFEMRHPYGKTEVAFKLYADPGSKRMLYYRLEFFDSDKSRIYLRTLSDILYDCPAP